MATITHGDEATVFVDGELDLFTAPLLERELAAAAGSAARSVVVDLDGVEFVDLSGFRPITALARRPGLRVAITDGSAPVRHLLDVVGVARGLHVISSSGRP